MEVELAKKHAKVVLLEYQTDGHAPLLVITDDNEQYVAKSGKSHNPPITLTNEILCSFFLRIWGIPTPEIALIKVKPGIIDFQLSSVNRLHFYEDLCFGSKFIEEPIENINIFEVKTRAQYQRIENPTDFLWIALFDIWVENEDRKPSNPNLIFSNQNDTKGLTIYAIDHAYTFLTQRYTHLNPEWGVSQSDNDSILYSEIGKNLRQRVKTKEKKQYYEGFMKKIKDCQKNYFKILRNIPPELGLTGCDAIFLMRFLFDKNRNLAVFDDFIHRL